MSASRFSFPPLGPVPFAILTVLRAESLYAREIGDAITGASSGGIVLGASTLHYSLQVLAREGLVETGAPGGRGNTRRYSITPKGKDQLARSLTAYSSLISWSRLQPA